MTAYNASTYAFSGGAGVAQPGPITGSLSDNYAALDGATGTVTTSLSGGTTTAGSIMAWVKLGALPSAGGATYYVAGESTSGNDFDLQFTSDNCVAFLHDQQQREPRLYPLPPGLWRASGT